MKKKWMAMVAMARYMPLILKEGAPPMIPMAPATIPDRGKATQNGIPNFKVRTEEV